MARGGYVTDLDEVVASSDLKEELKSKMKEGDKIVAFAYTDYGGSFGDKVAIEYFKENHPKNIVFENSAYNGQNGIVFGEVAKDFLEETEDYPLGYEDMESFYYDMQNAQEEKDFKLFLSDLKNKYTIKKDALDWLLENKGGYYSIEPNMVDFSYSELENELEEEGLIKKKKMADGGMANGGQVDNYKHFDLNSEGNFTAKKNGKNYEVIYRDDISGMYDLFENDKKIKSSKVIRDLMQFPKEYNNGGGVSNSLEEMMKNNDRIRTAVKMKFALAIGIDKAIKILDRDWAVSPYNLLISAVLKGFITIDDIDKNLSDEAIIQAEDVDSRYKDSGEGIGSSDMNAFIRSMLRSANVEERKMGTGGGIGNKFTYSIGGL